jgi:hypothetical protein
MHCSSLQELLFDYSTCVNVNEPFVMECACGDPACRRVISHFFDMPEDIQEHYISMGVVPVHVKVAYAEAHGLLPRQSHLREVPPIIQAPAT